MPIVPVEEQGGRPVLMLSVCGSRATRMSQVREGLFPHPPERLVAMLDTGASMTKVCANVLIDRLNLDPTGEIREFSASTGSTPVICPTYRVMLQIIGVPNGVLAYELEVSELPHPSGLPVDCLLGRDVLDACLFVYQGGGRSTLAFDPPSDPIH